MIYSRIKYDIFFKKVFSQEHILKAFLNTVLAGELPAPIVKLTYQPTDFITKSERQYLNAIKHTIIDVFVTTETGARPCRNSKRDDESGFAALRGLSMPEFQQSISRRRRLCAIRAVLQRRLALRHDAAASSGQRKDSHSI